MIATDLPVSPDAPRGTPPIAPRPPSAFACRIMRQHGLSPSISKAASEQAAAVVVAAVDPSSRDLRTMLWASVDGESSRDLDQLSVAQSLDGGSMKVWVAISDVDAVVRAGSALDTQAAANATSVYTVAGAFPMLPDSLSTNLTSFLEGEERLAIVVEMTVGPDGSMQAADIYRALVRNEVKLGYGSVSAWLDDTVPLPCDARRVPGLEAQVQTQDRAARALRGFRYRRGALGLHASQPHGGGRRGELATPEANAASEMIEDLLVAANGAIARFLSARGYPCLRRVLRSPSRWPRLMTLAAAAGHALPDEPSAGAIAAFLSERSARDPAGFADLSVSVAQLLGRAEYRVAVPGEVTSEAHGHFGLSVREYTHATAPNRRFADLVTQRLLKAAIDGRPCPYSLDQLRAVALHCSDFERRALKVERQVEKSAAARGLASHRGEWFEGVVTGASPKGTWVRIHHPLVEGRVTSGCEGADVGDHVRVQLVRTDVEHGFVDFAMSAVEHRHVSLARI